jgi:hypothetical protein
MTHSRGSKTHFLISLEPIDFAVDLPCHALCGRLLAHPSPEAMWEITNRGLPEFNSLRDCAKCMRKVEEYDRDPVTGELQHVQRTYVYGIREAEEVLQESTA